MEGMGIVYLALLIPLVVTGVFYLFKKHEFTWWEFFVPIASVALIILISVKISEKTSTNYSEYWGSTVTTVTEEEPYNYWQHQTCTRTTTDSKGNTHVTTYDCSHQVDVGPSWEAVTNLNEHIAISEDLHDELVVQFGTGKKIIKTRKNHDSGDRCSGSKGTKFEGQRVGKTSNVFRTVWGGENHTRKTYNTQHQYENRIKASDLSIFNISVVKKSQVDSLGLYEYPLRTAGFGKRHVVKKTKKNKGGVTVYNGWDFPTILGENIPESTQEKFRQLNGKFGPTNEMRFWVLVFEDTDQMTGVMQENYWVRGNMNELVLCIGKSGEEIQWAHAFSWATSDVLTVEIRNAVLDLYTYKDSVVTTPMPPVLGSIIKTAQPQEKIIRVKTSSTPVLTEETWDNLYNYLSENLQRFERRHKEEFEYVKIIPTKRAKIIIYILALVIAIIVNIVVTTNDIYDGHTNLKFNNRKYGNRRFY